MRFFHVTNFFKMSQFSIIRAHTRPLVRLRLLHEAQQKHEGQHTQGQNGVEVMVNNSEINGSKTKKKSKKHTIVTLSDSPLIQEHKVSG